jgi:penicillin amidase
VKGACGHVRDPEYTKLDDDLTRLISHHRYLCNSCSCKGVIPKQIKLLPFLVPRHNPRFFPNLALNGRMNTSTQNPLEGDWTLKRLFVHALIGIPAFIVLVGVVGFLWLRTSLPTVSGVVQLDGVGSAVSIKRDGDGIPHISADTDNDAYFALGYVHAQDRFWQMESMRRYGAGRLSEVFGEPTIGIDRWMRTLGLYRLAKQQVKTLDPPVTDALDAYANGVNSWLGEKFGLYGLEFAGIRYVPEPWVTADSLVWGKIMATRLGGNFPTEVLRTQIAKRINPERVGELWPSYPSDAPVTITNLISSSSTNVLAKLASLAPENVGKPIGASNFWALGPSLTDTGGAILANDPHLGFSAPIMWYLAEIVTPDLNIRGATVPGVPFHILGANTKIAWGITSTQADTEDLFVEKISTNDSTMYAGVDDERQFDILNEVIKIKGKDDLPITIRSSHHGPIISDIREDIRQLGDDGHAIALSATYLRESDQTTEAFYLLNRANSWKSFRNGLRQLQGPVLNFVYADVAGNIGYQTAGMVPVRKSGSGIVPSPGWLGNTDWIKTVPFAEMPFVYNPPSSKIVNANNRVVGPNYPHFISHDWAARYRAERIENELDQNPQISLAHVKSLQSNAQSLMARDILPALIKAVTLNEKTTPIIEMLKEWDGTMSRKRIEPLIFSTWMLELNKLVYSDELGELTPWYLKLRPRFIKSVLSRRQAWCDDVSTEILEGCDELINIALDKTLVQLSDKYGSNIDKWVWGAAHQATFTHKVFTRIPVINRLADIKIPSDGGNYTVNRGASRPNNTNSPFAHIHGSGFRAVYDLSDLKNSRFMIATGQSGNPLSSHYSDLVTRWRDGKYVSFMRIGDGTETQIIKELLIVPITD